MTEHTGELHEHITPTRTYVLVGLTLLVLTGLTVGASFLDLGVLNDVVALGIAATKAVLIILIFMHLRYASPLTKLVVVTGVLFAAILIVGVLDDLLTRAWLGIPGH